MTAAVDIFSSFATDSVKEKEGVYTQVPGAGAAQFLIARSGSAAYNRILSGLFKRNKAVLESQSDEAQAMSDKVMAETYAKTILLGWKDTVPYKGEALTYSEANAKKLLMHKDFRTAVESVASDFNNFKVVNEAEEEKNLPSI